MLFFFNIWLYIWRGLMGYGVLSTGIGTIWVARPVGVAKQLPPPPLIEILKKIQVL
jgi:hypothetical protein